MRRLLREPLLHFLLLGGAAFALYALTRAPAGAVSRAEIRISAEQIEQLTTVFTNTWQRPPKAEEIENLIESRIREEVFFREALAARLNEDDAVIRRRMKQKLEFLVEDIAGQVKPTEQDLRTFLDENADRFRLDPRFTFRHVYFGPDRREDAAGDARRLLSRLEREGAGAEAESCGDRLMMVETEFTDAPRREVERVFGGGFAAKLTEAPTGRWSGPIRSGYGFHLVFVESRVEGEVPKLADVRDAVEREWSAARRRELNDALYRKLRAKYEITVERE